MGIHGSGMVFRNGSDVRIHSSVGMKALIHVTDAEYQIQVVAGLMDIGVVNGGGSSLVGSPAISIVSLAVQVGKGDARETLHTVIVFFCYTCISLKISKVKVLAMVFTALKAL